MAEWWRGAVIYQIYPRSFQDSNGDGIGDLNGIRERLDHVARLGVDGIWLSPVFTSPMRDFGYDVSDYRGIDPLFGTLEDFDALLARAHALGLKVVIDQVYSHTSDRHPWFAESRSDRANPKADWYVWADPRPDGTPPNNWLSVFGGSAWEWDTARRQYYLHNFLIEQPDLDLHNPAVQDAILDVARFWLDRGVDGFRLDVANFYMCDPLLTDNPPRPADGAVKPYDMQQHLHDRSQPENLAFLARLRALMDTYPGRMAVAEVASDRPVRRMVEYIDGEDRLHTAYSFYLLGPRPDAAYVRRGFRDILAHSGTAWPSWAFSNHDVPRVATRWGGPHPDPAFVRQMLALLFSLRGTIFLYQGEELGLPQADIPFERLQDPEGKRFWPRHKGRDGSRTPMPWRADQAHAGFSGVEPWLPVDPRHADRAVALQEDDRESPLAFTRRFLDWRRRHPALVTGDIDFLEAPEPVLAFLRRDAAGRVLCVFNLGDFPAVADTAPWGGLPGPLDGIAGASSPRVEGGRLVLPPHGMAFATAMPPGRD